MTTHLTLQRNKLSDKSTLGSLSIGDVFECFTLEDKVREVPGHPVSSWKIPNQTAIPAGTYQVIIDMSARFKRLMPHILDVPGFDGIRIHWGNTDVDTDGCILLGKTIGGPDFIGESRVAFDAFFSKLQAALEQGDVYITIENTVSV
jgi:hypothetical protein